METKTNAVGFTVLPTDTDSMLDALGISKERSEQLDDDLKQAFVTTDKNTDAMQYIAERVNNVNEFALQVFGLGKALGRMHASEALEGIELLKQIRDLGKKFRDDLNEDNN